MGDIADYYMDIGMDWEESQSGDYYHGTHYDDMFKAYQQGKLEWFTKEGKGILVENMTDNHVLNTRHFIIHKNTDKQYLKEWIIIFTVEAKKRNLNF